MEYSRNNPIVKFRNNALWAK